MPPLPNPKHEIFAQGLAAGKSQADAYTAAGYQPSDPNASRLTTNDKVQTRVAELQARVTQGVVLTKQWVLEKLIENVERSMQAKEVVTRAGVPTGVYVYDGAVANKALELLGKESGMFVERTENANVHHIVSGQPLTEAEWAEQHTTAH